MTNLLGEGIFNLAVILSLAVILKRERERRKRKRERKMGSLFHLFM